MKRRRSGLLIKLAVLALVIWGAVTLVQLRLDIAEAKENLAALQLERDRQKRENALSSELLAGSSDQECIEKVARDELGYVSAGEQIFYDVSD